MIKIFHQTLIIAYAGVAIISIIGYLPTIKDLWLSKKMSANIHSYFIWAACFGVTFLYSLFILSDRLFQLFAGINFIACTLIIFLAVAIKNNKN